MVAEGNVPLTATFGVLLDAWHVKDHGVFMRLWEKMKAMGVQPDGSSYNLLIRLTGEREGYVKAKEVFDEYMRAQPTPDGRVFTTMISLATAHRSPREAIRLIEEMRRLNVRLDVVACNSVLNVLAAKGDTESAESIFQDMVTNKLTPDIVTFRTMLKCYVTAGTDRPEVLFRPPFDRAALVVQPEKALQFLARIQTLESGMAALRQDNSIFHLLFKCFVVANDIKKSLELYELVRSYPPLGRVPRLWLLAPSSAAWAATTTPVSTAG